ncbi:MAG: NADH-quinone oxidoreductase subunit NuoE [Gallionella sp.]|nr:NADH-quinone oxidoreductase subunit NuoE [Gallionella sp.]NCP80607.1 NADH-quinone oxidoreductase subunit NuoE [Gallionella sp.]NCS75649.1 NADH-quinone oxidoreductase subunit NuoE [Gallionella sp.]OIO11244.1 MAG: NAD(P)H-dependent oxidoreductase subunit E [Gallionellaceae bacterium CG1_02_60_325]PIR09851.1 MAG: NADH-quinone oxidoreductase subunit NuoE [Gallionellaceae bacterium CG11_big_fil_rev_8_21_14_0_20_60_62]
MLSQPIQTLIDKELKKYPADQRQSAVMAALRFVQDEKGWIAPEDMADVASYLGMQQMAVYEVATFYHMYNLKPMGRHTLTVCTNLSCTLCGAGDTVAYLEQKLGIKLGEVTADGKFGLREGECMGACVAAPLLTLNNRKLCGHLTNEKIDQILADLEGGKA